MRITLRWATMMLLGLFAWSGALSNKSSVAAAHGTERCALADSAWSSAARPLPATVWETVKTTWGWPDKKAAEALGPRLWFAVKVAVCVAAVGTVLIFAGGVSFSVVAILTVTAGVVSYWLYPGVGTGENRARQEDSVPSKPPPIYEPPQLDAGVLFRVAFESDGDKPVAKHFFNWVDWRAYPGQPLKIVREQVAGKNRGEWKNNLQSKIKEIREKWPPYALKEFRKVEIVLTPDPGKGTLDDVEELIRELFGGELEISRKPNVAMRTTPAP